MGAEGLDLVQASHIFLLEPLLNAALEAQAVNRIHRIGQVRPPACLVTYLLACVVCCPRVC
jgi:hypothetical protein